MSATDETSTSELAHEEKAALAAELFAPGVGAQAGPPTTPATATGSAGDTPPGAHSHGGPAPTGSRKKADTTSGSGSGTARRSARSAIVRT